MTRRRPSIARLMAAIALVAASLGLFRTGHGEITVWDDSYDTEVWLLGELAPILAIGLSAFALVLVTSGRLRRFALGMAATGLVTGLAFWLAPMSARDFVLERIIRPIDFHFGPRHPGQFFTDLDLTLLWFMRVGEDPRRFRTTRAPFGSRPAQAELGLLELAVASIGGLMAAIPRPKPPIPDHP